MELTEALYIVYELALDNALEPGGQLDDGLEEEAARQQAALDVVHNYIESRNREAEG